MKSIFVRPLEMRSTHTFSSAKSDGEEVKQFNFRAHLANLPSTSRVFQKVFSNEIHFSLRCFLFLFHFHSFGIIKWTIFFFIERRKSEKKIISTTLSYFYVHKFFSRFRFKSKWKRIEKGKKKKQTSIRLSIILFFSFSAFKFDRVFNWSKWNARGNMEYFLKIIILTHLSRWEDEKFPTKVIVSWVKSRFVFSRSHQKSTFSLFSFHCVVFSLWLKREMSKSYGI